MSHINNGKFRSIPKERSMRLEYLLQKLVTIGISLTAQRDPEKLFEVIIDESMEITNCDGASIYIVKKEGEASYLSFHTAKNYSRDIAFQSFTLPINKESIAGYCAYTGEIYNFQSVDEIPEILGIKYNDSFDKSIGYKTVNMMVVPMKNIRGDIIGVLQLINKKNVYDKPLITQEDFDTCITPFSFSKEEEALMQSLASQTAMLIERNNLYGDIKRLFKTFTESMVTTIDQRDPATSGHSMRVANYAYQFGKVIGTIREGKYGSLTFTDNQLMEIYYAGLLHDIGKIGVKERVLLKKDKLSEAEMEAIKYRFHYLKKDLQLKKATVGLKNEEEEQLSRLEADYAWLYELNKKHYMTDEEAEMLTPMMAMEFTDIDGVRRPLLHDEEMDKLSVRKGNLTEEERKMIEEHPSFTYEVLQSIAWGQELQHVPRIAACHHEKLNGTGYPWQLSEDEIPVRSKMLAIVDIFDALTAKDRPYKPALSHEVAYKILREEAERHHVDADLLDIFIEKKDAIINLNPSESNC